MTTVLFACVHNAGRSQMAAAFFQRLARADTATAVSAGTEPARAVHAVVELVMREVGIDLSGVRPRLLTPELAQRATLLITMGCGEQCPHVPGVEIAEWTLPDPQGRSADEVRAIRDDIKDRVATLVYDRGWS